MSRVIAVKQAPERRVIRAGMRGRVGPTITAASVGADGHLILSLEGGTEIDAGVIDRPWGTIQGEITDQLDLMVQLGLKVDQASYDAFATGVAAGLAERYTKPETDALVASRTTPAQAAAAAPVQSVQGRTGDVAMTKADVGLGSADNTSDMAKPVSTAQSAALTLKVNVTDVLDQLESADATKPLSANQGRVLKELIDNIQTLLESDNVNLDSLQEVVDFIEQNREDLQNLAISNIAGLQAALDSKAATNGDYVNLRARATTAEDVGLGQADNTPDASKPISGPQQAGLDLKVDKVAGRGLSTEDYTTDEKSKLAGMVVGTGDSELPTNLTVMDKLTAWWNGATSAFGSAFVATTNPETARGELELGTFATADYAAAPFINVMPDSGRFGGKVNPLELYVDDFVSSDFFASYNGSAQSSAGKFIHNNTTNGGSRGVLTEPVASLLTKLGRSSALARYGTEFYVLRITAGSGTQTPSVGTDAVTRYLLSVNNLRSLFGSEAKSTFVGYLRCVSGSAHIAVEHYQDGTLVPAGTPIGADWRHCRVVLESALGYENGYPRIQTTTGAVVELAIGAFFTGFVDVGLHKSPLPTINELSA